MDTQVKSAIDSITNSFETVKAAQESMQRQLDAQDIRFAEKHVGGFDQDPLKEAFEQSAELTRLRELGKGRAIISVKDLPSLATKTTITSSAVGSGTPGVLAPQLVGSIVPTAQRRLFMRDLLSRGNRITGNQAYYIRETAFTNAASPQLEAAAKGESTLTFDTVSKPVVTLAHWIPASRQVLDDMPALLEYVRTKLLYGLRYVEDQQILAGSGTGQDLTGLITSATAFSTSLLSAAAGYTRIDQLRVALEQVEIADEVPAGFFVVHPIDWSLIERTKDGFGRYIVGDARAALTPSLWGRPVVVTTAITSGTFLAGSSESAELFDRMDSTVEISTEHSDYFVKNLVAIRAECREVLVVYRPHAFIYGTFVTSPVS